MKLPFLSFVKKEEPKEYFLSLMLQDERIQAVVFEEIHGTIHIVGEGKAALSSLLDDTSFENLLSATDKAISQAESALPENIQSHKTIFGLKEDWTEDEKIDKEHLAVLKKLCAELDLQPIGFLVFAEAISHLLQKQEGAPVSAILVDIGEKKLTATLLRAGRVITSRQTDIGEDIPQSLDKLFMHFTDVEILPSRIILVQANPSLSRQMTNHTWSNELPFLHVPQITSLAPNFVTQAILFGTATQMGFDVQNGPRTRLKSNQTVENNEDQSENEIAIETTAAEEEKEPSEDVENKERNLHEASADNFGFVANTDVLENVPTNPKSFDDFSIPENETEEKFAQETFSNIPEEVKEKEEKSALPGLGANAVMITEGMQNVLNRLKKVPFASIVDQIKQLPTLFSSDEMPTGGKKLILIAPVILLILLSSLLWYIFGIKATATLLIKPKIVQASQGVTFTVNGNTDTSSDIIAAASVPITENGTVTVQATGSKDIGDKAKGTIKIVSGITTTTTLPKGTVISYNNLKYTLDKDTTIASSSGIVGDVTTVTGINVTAIDIGTQYNLPSGTKFTVSDYSQADMIAENDSAFSGGTKKTITVVSQSDIDKATSELTKNLGQKAQQDMQKNINGGANILPVFLSTTMSNKQYNHKAGDQVSSLTLTATINYDALSYNKSDLDKVAQAIIQANNQGENISTQNIQEDIKDPTVSKNEQSINATLAIKAGLLPKIDTNDVAKALAGKSFSSAQSVLTNIPQLSGVKATLSPNLFFLPQTFPHIASHILVGVVSNE